MLEMNLQFFGGRGGASGKSAGVGKSSSTSISGVVKTSSISVGGRDYVEGKKLTKISQKSSTELISNSPVGTKIDTYSHQEGDYKVTYEKTGADSWVSTAKYSTQYSGLVGKNLKGSTLAKNIIDEDVKISKIGK